jgi:hypothetical protein
MKSLSCICIFLLLFAAMPDHAAAQWYAVPQMQNIDVTCMLAVSDSTIFVGGYFHSLYRSTDTGQTWTNTAGQIPVDTILSLAAAGKYIFAGTNDGICRSSDQGDSWEKASDGLEWGGGAINEFAVTDSAVYAATSSGVYQSKDFGSTWIPANGGLKGMNTPTMYITIPADGIVSTPSGLYTVQDLLGGASVLLPGSSTWKFAGLAGEWFDGGAMIVLDTSIFVGGMDGVFMYSGHDTTWLPRRNGLPQYLEFCTFTSAGNLLFMDNDYAARQIYVTSDFGQLWTTVSNKNMGNAVLSCIAANKKYLFAGTQGGVWRIPLSSIPTSVKSDGVQTPERFALLQNYPNPFNPSTVISYQLAVSSDVTLKVYDILGREVATLVDENKSPGSYQAKFDGSRFASGVYFYRLEAGSFSAVKKFVLMK